MSLKNYWAELHRRHVVKAGIAYLVSSWVIVQVAGFILDAFQYDIDYKQTLIIILAVCFPIWLIIAWIYDFSPEGITKTDDVEFDPEISRKKNINLNRFIIGGLAIAVILLGFTNYKSYAKAKKLETERTELFQNAIDTNYMASIAVLLFDAISGPEQDVSAYPTGIGQEIHQELTKIKDLRVVSTTSSYQIDKETMNIKTIGDTLKVDYILDGNVIQFQDTHAKINVELINTQNDNTLWAKEFNFEIADVLSVWDDIAKQVSDFVGLTKEYDDVRNKKVDPEAYDLYLKAIAAFWNSETMEGRAIVADSLIKLSIKIDPSYAPSQTILAQTSLARFQERIITPEEAIRIGKKAINKAIDLRPNYAPALAWSSNYKWRDGDYENSRRLLDSTLKYGANDVDVLNYAIHFYVRLNKLEKAQKLVNKALRLAPENFEIYSWAMVLDLMSNKPKKALLHYNEFSQLTNDQERISWRGYQVYKALGDYDKALEFVEKLDSGKALSMKHWGLLLKQSVLWNMGNLEEADRLLEEAINIPVDSLNPVDFADRAVAYAERKNNDQAFFYLNEVYSNFLIEVVDLFVTPEFKNLYDDPRWDAYLKRLGEYYNYDYTQSE